MNELALFAGAGGGILGGKLLGWRTRCAVEIDAYARKVLLARQRDRILEPFPIWDDVRTFDGKPWNGTIDVISGGFPCQDISAAGKGKGITGERSGLWKEFARIIGEVRPRFVFVENSPLLVSRGIGQVLADLSEMGFNAEWGSMRNGELWGRTTPEHLTSGTASGLLQKIPTPVRSDYRNRGPNSKQQGLSEFVRKNPKAQQLWATPSARDWKDTPGMAKAREDGTSRIDQLARQVYATQDGSGLFSPATATTTESVLDVETILRIADVPDQQWMNVNIVKFKESFTPDQKSGSLNPPWVEWLMGWPIEWTDLKPLETDRYQKWQQLHGQF